MKMTENSHDLFLIVSGGPKAGPRDVYELAQQLIKDLRGLDSIESVQPLPEDQLPEAARGLPGAVGTLLVKLAESPVVAGLVNLLSSWTKQTEGHRLKLQLGDSILDLPGLSAAEPQELIRWLQAQAGLRLTR
jgi:hypothetical protein